MMENNANITDGQKKRGFKSSVIYTAIIIIAAVAIFSAQSYAYFLDSVDIFNNEIASGSLDVEIVEGQGAGSNLLSFINPPNIVPGTTVQKEITIKNSGSLPMYARVRIEKNILNLEDQMPDGWEELISCNIVQDDESTADVKEGHWIYRDGYYYYTDNIEAGSVTPVFFDEVKFSEKMGNEFANRQIQIKVICEAVQSNVNSESPLTAYGWPVENSGSQEQTTATETNNTPAAETKEGME